MHMQRWAAFDRVKDAQITTVTDAQMDRMRPASDLSGSTLLKILDLPLDRAVTRTRKIVKSQFTTQDRGSNIRFL